VDGDPGRGLAVAQRSADIARRLRAERLWTTAVCYQAIGHAQLGQAAEADRYATEALRRDPDDLEINTAIWGSVRAHQALLADDQDRLLETLERAASTCGATRAPHRPRSAVVGRCSELSSIESATRVWPPGTKPARPR
jgi:hypothetical protein